MFIIKIVILRITSSAYLRMFLSQIENVFNII